MKFLLLFMFVAVALASNDTETREEHLVKSFVRVFRMDPKDALECIHKSEVKIEDLRYMEDVIDVSDTEATDMNSLRRASCAMVCCVQKIGVMVGGEVQTEELITYLKASGMPEDIESNLRTSVTTCKKQVTDTSDECMAGYKLIKCVVNTSQIIAQHK